MVNYRLKVNTIISNTNHKFEEIHIKLPIEEKTLKRQIENISVSGYNSFFVSIFYTVNCHFNSFFDKKGIVELNHELLKLNRITLNDIDEIMYKSRFLK